MSKPESLHPLRDRIDEIDSQLFPLFRERMEIAEQVAAVKQEKNLPITDTNREQQIIDRLTADVDDAFRGEVSLLARTILTLSKRRQRAAIFPSEAPMLPEPRSPVTKDITCVYQGVPGAWSEHATIQAFPDAKREHVPYFEDVFLAVRDGKADYGVVAIENTQTGAIGETYDLLRRYSCYIVGRTGVPIRHCLLAPQGTKLDDVRAVYSHPEGFKQCRSFLRHRSWDQMACTNTAVAAQTVRDAADGRSAAIGSRRAAEHFGLEILKPDIMDSAANQTFFVVIAPQPEYDETSDHVSITFATIHRSGALSESLMPFVAHGISLDRLESRPGTTAGSYRFFADIQGNYRDPDMQAALQQAAAASEYFEVIGCYKNI